MMATQEWFKNSLMSPEGEKAREYLKKRGFDAHTIERFGFGYAPEGRQALKTALGGQFEERMLVEAGLRIQVEDKEPYDRFRGRLMLPIEDVRGRIVGFGGRILDNAKTDAPKYLNSPDTPLFDKGRTLYNLNRAGPISRQSGRIVVVEGYMDVIALAAAGIGDAVAPMGTALTERQIELLWRLVEVPVLCFDGDAAGQRAAIRAISRALPLLRPGHSLSIVRLPAGLDPDDLVKQRGAAAMEKLLASPQSLLEAIWEYERDAEELKHPGRQGRPARPPDRPGRADRRQGDQIALPPRIAGLVLRLRLPQARVPAPARRWRRLETRPAAASRPHARGAQPAPGLHFGRIARPACRGRGRRPCPPSGDDRAARRSPRPAHPERSRFRRFDRCAARNGRQA